ncbi:MAG: M3 family metallopeptidase [Anaerolineae bacterium]|nr:M3 family metallopeptidase [Anaerolineae bacterium]
MNAAPTPSRSQVPVEHTWDTASIFETTAAWETAMKEIEAAIPNLRNFQGRLGESPQTLTEWLHTKEALVNDTEKAYIYAHTGSAVDASDQQAAARKDRAYGLYSRVMAATAFDEPEIVSIGFDTLTDWMESHPSLKIYAHYIDQLNTRAEHIASPEIEQLLSQVMDPFYTATATHSILVNADMTIEPVSDPHSDEPREVTHSNLVSNFLVNTNREIRRKGWENYADAHLAFQNTMASILAAGVKQNVFKARARKYTSALEAALKPKYIPVDVFHNLIATFKTNLPTWHRYWDIRKRALGLDEFHIYDRRAALTENMPQLSFEQALEWIEAGMQPLGDEYVGILSRGVRQELWVDKYPNKGKRFGAFSSGTQGTHHLS